MEYSVLHTIRRIFLPAALVASTAACSNGPIEPQDIGEGRPVLFIGNSHTYVNDVPGLLQALADSGGEKIAVLAVAGANMALIDHWNLGAAKEVIESRNWDFVVMQQGWTPAGVCQDTLRMATQLFSTSIRSAGAVPALYQVWPATDRQLQWQGTIESYRAAASDVDGLLLPVAEAWLALLERTPTIQLYQDGLHANSTGAYLTALVMYARMFNRTPVGLPAQIRTRSGITISVPEDVAAQLQAVAAEIGLAPTPDEEPKAEPVITSRC